MTNSTVSNTTDTPKARKRRAARTINVYRALVRLHDAGEQGIPTKDLGIALATAKTQIKAKGLVRVEKIETGKQGRPQFKWILTAKGREAGASAINIVARVEAEAEAAAARRQERATARAERAAAKAQKDAAKLSKALGAALNEAVSEVTA